MKNNKKALLFIVLFPVVMLAVVIGAGFTRGGSVRAYAAQRDLIDGNCSVSRSQTCEWRTNKAVGPSSRGTSNAQAAPAAVSAQGNRADTIAADKEASGNVASDTAEEEKDYNLVVLEEDEVPLAANVSATSSGEDLKKRQTMVIWVVSLVFIAVCAAGYFAYFYGYRKRVAEIRRKIPREERGPACAPTIVFQPNRWKDIADDYENELASKYID